MKNRIYTLLIFASLIYKPLYSQNLLIKPNFSIGDSLSYIVSEEEKTSSLIVLSKGKHQFEVKFLILDTSNGYTINFTTKLIKPIGKKFVIESTLDKLRDGINLTYKLNNSGWLIDIVSYRNNQLKAVAMLDSIAVSTDLSRKELGSLQYLRNQLEKPDGLQLLLGPIILFNQIYLNRPFRNQKDYYPSSLVNIFYQPQITGTGISKLNKIDIQSGMANVSIDFIANRDSAAKVIIPMYKELLYEMTGKMPKLSLENVKCEFHSQYEVEISKGYPQHIFKRQVIVYGDKSISETNMEILNK